jgi:hypothetical protein
MGYGSTWSGTGPLLASGLQVIGVNGAELDIDTGAISGGNFPEIIFWNSAHTDYGKISLEVNPTSSPNQMLELRSPAENSLVLPGNPPVQMRLFMSALMELGNVMPPNSNVSIGGTLFLDETLFDLECLDTSSVTVASISSSASGGVMNIHIGVTGDVVFGTTGSVFGGVGIVFDAASAELRAWNFGVALDWVNLTLQNGWTAKAGYYAPSYRFTPTGRIELRGVMTGGTNVDNTVVCLMPIVPAKLSSYGGIGITAGPANGVKRVFYNTDGKLYCYGVAGTVDLSLDGALFSYK